MSDDLIAWLRAQLDEDERAANAATWTEDPNGNAWRVVPPKAHYERLIVADGFDDGVVLVTPENGEPEAIAEHIARHNPARVLVEVEAKRRILSLGDVTAEMRAEFRGQFDVRAVSSVRRAQPTSR